MIQMEQLTKYKDCGQDQQMDEGWEEGVRVRKGAGETGRTDGGEHASGSHTLLCICASEPLGG